MIKRYSILLMLCFNFLKIQAQKNNIAFTVNSFMYFNNQANRDTVIKSKNKTIQHLPSLCYNRIIKNNLGIGLELGYRNNKYYEQSVNNFPANNFKQIISNSLPVKSYYLCPSVFKTYYWNNFQIITSLIIPLEYITKKEQILNKTYIDNNTNSTFNEIQSHIKWPKLLQFGIYGNIGFFCKVYEGLYIGPQLGIGIVNEARFGNGINSYKEHQNGILTTNETYTDTYTKYYGGNLDIRPTLRIHYNF